jgi:F-type H+-transporting ATPase subunit delta
MTSPSPSTDGDARKPQADVRHEQVAAVYAKALLGAAEKAGQAEAVVRDVDAVVNEGLDKFPELESALSSALVGHEEKARLIERLFAGKAAPLVVDFLQVVARHGRLGILRAIRGELQRQLDDLRRRMKVEVTAAAPLASQEVAALAASLRQLLAREPVLETRVDPELLGGVVVRLGDTVYDGSVATQLAHAREQLIYRSVHEIQSRRDRFRSAS